MKAATSKADGQGQWDGVCELLGKQQLVSSGGVE